MRTPLVLIVDDEGQIGNFAALFLSRAGFKTMRASSPSRALELFSDEVDVLLTDWVMPGMTGGQLAGRLLERNPNLLVLFMSGNLDIASVAGIALENDVNFIRKPFGAEELVNLVKNALTANREATPAH